MATHPPGGARRVPAGVAEGGSVFWMAEAGHPTTATASERTGDDDVCVDVAVIGGGCTGLSVAYWLRQLAQDGGGRGARGTATRAAPPSVVVLDARGIGQCASGRNGGHIYPDDAPNAGIARRYGEDTARDVYRFVRDTVGQMAAFVDAAEERAAKDGNPPPPSLHYRRGGGMMLFKYGEEVGEAAEALAMLPSDDVPEDERARPVHVDDMPAHGFPGATSHGIKGGVFNPCAAAWNPYVFTTRYLAPSVDAPVIHACAESLACEDNGWWRVACSCNNGDPARTIRARAVVLATNAYTTHLVPSAPITPVRGHCVATDLVLPCTNVCWDDGDVYVAATEGGCVVGGMRWCNTGTCEVGTTDDGGMHPDVSRGLRGAAEFLAGLLGDGTVGGGAAGCSVTHEWTGIMGFTPDLLPLVGELRYPRLPSAVLPAAAASPPASSPPPLSPRGLYCCAGFSGEGMPKIFGAARLIAAQILEALDPTRRSMCRMIPEPWAASVLRAFDPNRSFPEENEG